jgi:hypothetical protein
LRVFQIEIIERVRRNKLAGERGFTALARAEQRHNAAAFQSGANQLQVGFAVNHVQSITMKIRQSTREFHAVEIRKYAGWWQPPL